MKHWIFLHTHTCIHVYKIIIYIVHVYNVCEWYINVMYYCCYQVPGAVAAALPQTHTEPSTTTITSSQSQPNLLQHPSLHATPSHPPPPPTTGVATSEGTAEHRPSKSSFDRIVEKLVPHYPSYSRLTPQYSNCTPTKHTHTHTQITT